MTTAPKLPEVLEPLCDVSRAPLGFSNHEKSAWSIGCEEGLRSAQASLQALAAEKDSEIAALKLQLEMGPLYSTRMKAKRYDWLRSEHPAVHAFLLIAAKDKTLVLETMDAAIDEILALAEKEAK